MRLLLCTLVVLAGCSRAAEHLVGKWEFDAATYELIQKYQALSPEEKQHWLDTATMDVTFTKDTISWRQQLPGWGSMTAEGSYRVIEVDGKRITIDADLDRKRRLVLTVDENRLRFGLGGRSIILKRR